MSNLAIQKDNYTKLIAGISIAIPLAVAVLLFMPSKFGFTGEWVKLLPHINAVINSLTALLLIAAVVAVKQKQIAIHKALMTSAFVFGALFLVSYVIYHASVPSTVFGDTSGDGVLNELEAEAIGGTRTFYLIVLLSHILLSIVVVPFVLMAFYFALTEKIDSHKKIVKFTFPIWLYVSVTGVIAYLMISPYYQ